MAHFVQATYNLPNAESFNEACSGIWAAGGYVAPVGASPSSINVVCNDGIQAAVRDVIAKITDAARADGSTVIVETPVESPPLVQI